MEVSGGWSVELCRRFGSTWCEARVHASSLAAPWSSSMTHVPASANTSQPSILGTAAAAARPDPGPARVAFGAYLRRASSDC